MCACMRREGVRNGGVEGVGGGEEEGMQEAELGSDAQKMIAGRNSQCRQRFRLASPTILASGCCSTVNARGRAPLLCFGGSVSVGFVCNGTASPVPDPIFLPIPSFPPTGPRLAHVPA